MIKNIIAVKVCILLLLMTGGLHADAIYKSVDENGRTTYSSTPPASNTDADIIDITAPPSQDSKQAAQLRAEKNKEAAQQLDANRQSRNEEIEKDNRKRRSNQKQPVQESSEKDKSHYGYPYYPRKRPYPIHRPGRPIVSPRR